MEVMSHMENRVKVRDLNHSDDGDAPQPKVRVSPSKTRVPAQHCLFTVRTVLLFFAAMS
jgi:hypothetical protein